MHKFRTALFFLFCLVFVMPGPVSAQLVTVKADYVVVEKDAENQRVGIRLPEADPNKRQNWIYVKATTKFVKRTNLGNQTFRDEILTYDGFFKTVKKGDTLRVNGGRGWDGTITAKAIYF